VFLLWSLWRVTRYVRRGDQGRGMVGFRRGGVTSVCCVRRQRKGVLSKGDILKGGGEDKKEREPVSRKREGEGRKCPCAPEGGKKRVRVVNHPGNGRWPPSFQKGASLIKTLTSSKRKDKKVTCSPKPNTEEHVLWRWKTMSERRW